MSGTETTGALGRSTALDLFAGCGGMALGFEQAGFDVLAAVDNDPIPLAAHAHNFPLCESLVADVAKLSAAEALAVAAAGWRRRNGALPFPGLDLVFGGPSCQGFSVIGRRDPSDPRNRLIGQFARLVVELAPRWFALENVPGLLAPAHRRGLEGFYEQLADGGYEIAPPMLLDAADYRVPQERHRVFIVGAREGEPLPAVPTPAVPRVTVSEALDDLPPISRFPSLLDCDQLPLAPAALAAQSARQSAWVRVLNGFEVDPTNLADPRHWDPALLSGLARTAHTPAVRARFQRLAPGRRDPIAQFDRLRAEVQAPTLRAGTGSDRGRHTSARPVHHRSPRVICVREAARLHSLPDWFQLHHTKWHGLRQVGNSVPPYLARAVAGEIVSAAGTQPARRARACSR